MEIHTKNLFDMLYMLEDTEEEVKKDINKRYHRIDKYINKHIIELVGNKTREEKREFLVRLLTNLFHLNMSMRLSNKLYSLMYKLGITIDILPSLATFNDFMGMENKVTEEDQLDDEQIDIGDQYTNNYVKFMNGYVDYVKRQHRLLSLERDRNAMEETKQLNVELSKHRIQTELVSAIMEYVQQRKNLDSEDNGHEISEKTVVDPDNFH